jgi:hypothetical protein
MVIIYVSVKNKPRFTPACMILIGQMSRAYLSTDGSLVEGGHQELVQLLVGGGAVILDSLSSR